MDKWNNLFPGLEWGESWIQFLNNSNQQLLNQATEFWTKTVENSSKTAEVWKSYGAELQNLNQLWVNELSTSLESINNKEVNSPIYFWIELNNLYWSLMYEKTLGNLTQIPLLGPTRGLNNKLMQTFDAWVHLYPTSIAYQLLLVDIQIKSFRELVEELIFLSKQGKTISDWSNFQQLWSYTADKVFENAFASENNLKIRGKFLNAINQYKLCQQELMEIYLKMLNMPTRSEIDEVHQSIYLLRKEIKTLKKTIKEISDEPHAV